MERYSEYKDSGVQWIGEIPSHWGVAKLNYVFSHNTGKTLNSNLKGNYLPYLTTSNVYNGYFDLSSVKQMPFLDDEIERYTVKCGDLLICEGGDVGRCNIWKYNYNICYQNHLHRLRPIIDASVDYFYYQINLFKHLGVFENYSKGIGIKGLSSGTLGNTKLLLPPLAEQEKIVSYLEGKTSKIDAYVAEKEKEILLLQELKQKTIADAVTKGLNPDVKMKDSGISWIGMIPEHWETKRAKFMFKKNKRERRPEDEVITCFRDGQVTLRKNRRLTGFTESEKYDGYQGVRKGDLVIHQMDAFAGSIGVSDSDGMGTSVYHCCTPIGDYNVYYYAHLIRQMALSGFIQSLYKGIRERSSDFSFSVFGNQYLIIPSRAEQDEIVAYIDEKCKKIDTLVSELQAEIDNMKEYKQRLIADCVTGQVKI